MEIAFVSGRKWRLFAHFFDAVRIQAFFGKRPPLYGAEQPVKATPAVAKATNNRQERPVFERKITIKPRATH
ncbi:hypothetical protein BHE16_04210 [Neomicrococcus aestuarii]|uniref:Uncharacterized protein n=1 Tax=Neomicrococcus aestuarii TaxID=556325 RepID=A0A1L2ZMU2_9MICC|nr:hypothetical protein BHE16_04210 [Neomicrococcus aestuarii]